MPVSATGARSGAGGDPFGGDGVEVIERARDEGIDGGVVAEEQVERVVGARIEGPTADTERVRACGKHALDLGVARFPFICIHHTRVLESKEEKS